MGQRQRFFYNAQMVRWWFFEWDEDKTGHIMKVLIAFVLEQQIGPNLMNMLHAWTMDKKDDWWQISM